MITGMNANQLLPLLFAGILGAGLLQSAAAEPSYLETKLKDIVIPEVEFDDTPVSQAIEFLRSKSVELDDLEPVPAKKGVNVILLHEPQLLLNKSEQPPTISLKAKSITLGAVLRYVAQISGFKLDTHEEAVVIGTEDELRELRADLGLEDASEGFDEAPPVRIVPR